MRVSDPTSVVGSALNLPLCRKSAEDVVRTPQALHDGIRSQLYKMKRSQGQKEQRVKQLLHLQLDSYGLKKAWL